MISVDVMKNNIEKAIYEEHIAKFIRTVILYGSWAQQTNDENSDIDIFVICESSSDKITDKIERIILTTFEGYETDISIYDATKFETLLECGSLYLHHLYSEGVILFAHTPRYTKDYLFGKLRNFTGIHEDLLLYDRMIKKTEISLRNNNSNYFDMNILAILARNTMILICYYMKNPEYGKKQVFETCKKLLGEEFIFNWDTYCALMKYRSYYNRKNVSINLMSKEDCLDYANQVQYLISLALKKMDLKNSIDRLYYLLNDNPGHNFYTSYEIFVDFDRDLFFYLNNHMKKTYGKTVDSITDPFLGELIESYKNDDFIECIYNIIIGVKDIKKKSSNYSIDCPDIYTETTTQTSAFNEYVINIPEKICHSNFIEKFIRKFIGKHIKKNDENIIDNLNKLRKLIKEELKGTP